MGNSWKDFFADEEEKFRNQPAPFKYECPFALKVGSIRTRCKKKLTGHGVLHEGRGLEEYPYQTIEWNKGHSQEFRVDGPDYDGVDWEGERFYAWEVDEES